MSQRFLFHLPHCGVIASRYHIFAGWIKVKSAHTLHMPIQGGADGLGVQIPSSDDANVVRRIHKIIVVSESNTIDRSIVSRQRLQKQKLKRGRPMAKKFITHRKLKLTQIYKN